MAWTFYNSSGEQLIYDAATAGVTLSGTTDNTVTTVTAANAIQGEANLTFDGTTLTTAGQIAFPATQSASANANTLDDYEEGTFTPTLVDNSNTGGTYNGQVGRYQKIGNRCFFQLFLRTTNTTGLTGTDQAYITGLPFAAVNVTYAHAGAYACSYGSLGMGNALTADLMANASKLRLQKVTGSAGTLQITINEWSSDGEAIFVGQYETA